MYVCVRVSVCARARVRPYRAVQTVLVIHDDLFSCVVRLSLRLVTQDLISPPTPPSRALRRNNEGHIFWEPRRRSINGIILFPHTRAYFNDIILFPHTHTYLNPRSEPKYQNTYEALQRKAPRVHCRFSHPAAAAACRSPMVFERLLF